MAATSAGAIREPEKRPHQLARAATDGTRAHDGHLLIPFEPIGVREDRLEEYAQCLRLLFDQSVSTFRGAHYTLDEARCFPRPVQTHLRIWIGGLGEKRTLPAAVKYADGWNCPYIGADEFARKSRLLDGLCAKHGRDPRTLARTANVAFYMGADAKSAARNRKLAEGWGAHAAGRTGFLVGEPRDAIEQAAKYRDAGVARLSIGVRAPFDWDALQAYRAGAPCLRRDPACPVRRAS